MILNSLIKEARIILSDLHSIGVLLILPIAFMLIMTFAMSEKSENIISKTVLGVNSHQPNELALIYKEYLKKQGFNVVDHLKSNNINSVDVLIDLPETFDENFLSGLKSNSITIHFIKRITPQKQKAVEEFIQVAFSKLRLHVFMTDNGDLDEDNVLSEQVDIIEESTNVALYFKIVSVENESSTPTLYSVPSWIIFGIYFIVLPVSITVINEEKNGTLIRLKTFPVSTYQYFMSKVSAFYILSLFQLILLTIVGVFIVPKVTGQPDIIIGSWFIYVIGAFFIILAANALAFFVASIVNSYEQAIVLGGGINILLAAVSGFMVPIDILPDLMAEIATYSPLYWSAEIIRSTFINKEFSDVTPYILRLLGFSIITLSLASYLFINKIRKLMWN